MNWNKFDNDHNYQKKVILIFSCFFIVVLLIVILFLSGSRAYFVMKNAPLLDEKLLKKDICYHAFNSISQKAGNPLVIDSVYLSSMEKIDYSFIDYQINHDLYRIIKDIGNDTCKIVIAAETENSHSLRSFQIKLIKDESYAFNYKAVSIGEILLDEKDVTEAGRK